MKDLGNLYQRLTWYRELGEHHTAGRGKSAQWAGSYCCCCLFSCPLTAIACAQKCKGLEESINWSCLRHMLPLVIPGKYEERFSPLCFSSRREALIPSKTIQNFLGVGVGDSPQKGGWKLLLMVSGGCIASVMKIYHMWSRSWQNYDKRKQTFIIFYLKPIPICQQLFLLLKILWQKLLPPH